MYAEPSGPKGLKPGFKSSLDVVCLVVPKHVHVHDQVPDGPQGHWFKSRHPLG